MRDVLLTRQEAAAWFKTKPSTVRGWIERYHVQPAQWRERTTVYRLSDLTAAEHKARSEPRGRPRGVAQ